MWQRSRIIFILCLLAICADTQAQSHGVEIAPRGGVSLWRAGEAVQASMAPAAGADIAYLLSGYVSSEVALGVRLGVGVGYTRVTLNGTPADYYTLHDYEGRRMDYATSAKVREQHMLLSAELPLMATLSLWGVRLEAGARMRWLVSDTYVAELSDPVISATYTDYGVTMTNRLITGVLSLDQLHQQGKYGLPRGGIQLGGELGYTWTLHEGLYSYRRLTLALYAYYDVATWAAPAAAAHYIEVSPITSAINPVPEVRVNTLGAFASDLKQLQLGVRLAYSIESIDNNRYGWHR